MWTLAAVAVLAALQSADFASSHATGEALIRQGKCPEAIPHLENAQKADASHYANSWDLALCYLNTGRLDAARAQVGRMIVRQDKGELHYLMADIEARAGKPAEAAREYETAVRLDPAEKHLLGLGNHLIRYGAFQDALKVFQYGLGLHPKSPELRVGYGLAQYSLSNWDDAIKALCEAADLAPSDLRPLPFLGKMIDVSPAYAGEVHKRLERYIKQDPDNPLANLYYGVSLWRRQQFGEPDASVAAIEKHLLAAVRLDPSLADARYQAGLFYESRNQVQDAIRQLREAARLDPQNDTIRFRLARLYQRDGQAALAQREMEIYKRLHHQKVGPADRTTAGPAPPRN